MKDRIRFALRVTVLFVFLLSAANLKSQTSDRESIEKTFSTLLNAYARGDIDAVNRCWEPSSPFRQGFLDMAERMSKNAKDIGFDQVRIANWRVDPPKSEISVQFNWTWTGDDGKPTLHEIFWEVRFVKHEGTWFIAAWRSVGEQVTDLSNQLLEASDHDARAKLLVENREFAFPGIAKHMSDAALSTMRDKKFDQALHLAEVSIDVAKTLQDDDQLASAYLVRGGVYFQQRQFDSALIDFETARDLFQSTSDKIGEAKARLDRGGALVDLGRSKDAEVELRESQKLAASSGDKETEASAAKNLGVLLQQSGDHGAAIETFQDVEAELARNGPSENLAGLYIDLGTELAGQGRFLEALDKLETGRRIAEQVKSVDEIRRAHLKLGTTYLALGKLDEAQVHFDSAVPANPDKDLFVRAVLDDDKETGEQVLTGLGQIHLQRHEYTYASLCFYITQLIADSLHDKARLARAHLNSGVVFDTAGEHEKALSQYDQGEQLFGEVGNWQEQASLEINKGFLHLDTGDDADAEQDFTKAKTSAGTHEDKDLLFRALWGLGSTYRARGQWTESVVPLEKAAGYIEDLRLAAPEPLLRASYFNNYANLFSLLVDSELQTNSQGSIARAFQFSERAKARSLTELIRSAGVDTRQLSPSERDQLNALRGKAEFLAIELKREESSSTSKPEGINKLKGDLNRAVAQYDEYHLSLKTSQSPQLGTVSFTTNTDAAAAELAPLFRVDPNIVVISYVVTPDSAWAFVVSKSAAANDANVQAFKLQRGGQALHSNVIDTLVDEFVKECSQPYGNYEPYARELYKLLVQPVEAALTAGGHIVIVPDGPINKLPFQALMDTNGSFFIEKHELSTAPSVEALVELIGESTSTNPPIRMTALGLSKFSAGLDDLPWAEKEAEGVAKLFGQGSQAFTASNATKTKAIATMPESSVIHLATHGEFNDVAPLYSGVFLAKSNKDDNGFLSAEELMSIDLHRSSLMVVSACESARGQQSDGEGQIGWTWAALVAGVPAVVVSQWALEDDSASLFMTKFYGHLVGKPSERFNVGGSLRQAQIEVLGVRRHPYYWAPFVLTGNWLKQF